MLGFHKNAKDLTGRTFGSLEALSVAGRARDRTVLWLCRCHECGGERVLRSIWLTRTAAPMKSCGCLPRPNRLPFGQASFNGLVKRYRETAAKAGRRWELTADDCRRLFGSHCHFCGIAPRQVSGRGARLYGTFTFNGIDRLDNTQGYVAGNVVPCCVTCNYAKRAMPVADFIAWIRRAAAHLSR